MAYVLALDQGTTSSRAILFGHDGATSGIAQREFTQHYPDVGWVEHDPYEILTSQLSSAVEVLGKVQVYARAIWLQSGLPTSARQPSSGIARAASRCTTQSCGRTGAARSSARS